VFEDALIDLDIEFRIYYIVKDLTIIKKRLNGMLYERK